MPRSRVVVAGLGDTGVLTAIRLARHHRLVEVVGISSKPGLFSGKDLGFRLTEPERWAHDFSIPFDRYRGLDRVSLRQGRLTGLDPLTRNVTVEGPDGTTTDEPYDVLVVATGNRTGFWRQPGVQTEAEIADAIRQQHEQVRSASSVAVIGGGPTAVGAAAHLAETFPDHQVSLYFPGSQALPHHHPNAWKAARPLLERLGVELHPGHRAVAPDEEAPPLAAGEVQFSTGQPAVKADVVLWAIGRVTPNTEWLPREILDPDGFVKVDETLRIAGLPEGWAVGDVAASDPLRSTANNFGAGLVADNIIASLRGRPLKPYRPLPHPRGSYLGGPLRSGLNLMAPNGRALRLPRWFGDRVMHDLLYERLMYGGIRPRRRLR